MRGWFKVFLAFGLVAAVADSVSAQGRGGFGGGMMGGPGALIGNPSVQKELKLDEAQVAKATEMAAANRARMQETRSQLEGLEGEELNKKRQEIGRATAEANTKALAAMLKPEQMARLRQISLQTRGAEALGDPAVAARLKVTDDQAEKVKEILTASQSEMREIFQSAGGDREAAMAKIQGLRKETNTKVMALMTEDQKATWKEMTGEPFEVVYPPRNQ